MLICERRRRNGRLNSKSKELVRDVLSARRDSYLYLGEADLFSANSQNEFIGIQNEQALSVKDERKQGSGQNIGNLNWSGRVPDVDVLVPDKPIKVIDECDESAENTHEDVRAQNDRDDEVDGSTQLAPSQSTRDVKTSAQIPHFATQLQIKESQDSLV